MLLNSLQQLQQAFEVRFDVLKAFGEGASILSLVPDAFQVLDDLCRRPDEPDNTGRDAQRIHVEILLHPEWTVPRDCGRVNQAAVSSDKAQGCPSHGR